jgi:hypothetical protein
MKLPVFYTNTLSREQLGLVVGAGDDEKVAGGQPGEGDRVVVKLFYRHFLISFDVVESEGSVPAAHYQCSGVVFVS